MNCDHCEFRVGCHIRKAHEDGTATFSCGMDFGSGNAETVWHRGRYVNGGFVLEYDEREEPSYRQHLEWFEEDFRKQLLEVYATSIKKTEAAILEWVRCNPICYTNPCGALLDGIHGVTLPATFPKPDVVTAERYDVVELFLQFPLGLPIELKGITV